MTLNVSEFLEPLTPKWFNPFGITKTDDEPGCVGEVCDQVASDYVISAMTVVLPRSSPMVRVTVTGFAMPVRFAPVPSAANVN